KTLFGYGINGNQHREQPVAICSDDDKTAKGTEKERELKSSLEGTAADKDDNTYKIDVEVVSRVVKEGNRTKLEYSLKVDDRNAVPLRIGKEKTNGRGPFVIWHAAASSQFHEALGTGKVLNAGKREPLVVSFPVERYSIRWEPLQVVTNG